VLAPVIRMVLEMDMGASLSMVQFSRRAPELAACVRGNPG
jgi:hypothetical protein